MVIALVLFAIAYVTARIAGATITPYYRLTLKIFADFSMVFAVMSLSFGTNPGLLLSLVITIGFSASLWFLTWLSGQDELRLKRAEDSRYKANLKILQDVTELAGRVFLPGRDVTPSTLGNEPQLRDDPVESEKCKRSSHYSRLNFELASLIIAAGFLTTFLSILGIALICTLATAVAFALLFAFIAWITGFGE